jgi:hypothetical protein
MPMQIRSVSKQLLCSRSQLRHDHETTNNQKIGYSMSSMVNWLANVLFNQITPIGMQNQGWKFYFFFVATNILSAIVIFVWYPETSGKTLEQMDEVRSRYRSRVFVCFTFY